MNQENDPVIRSREYQPWETTEQPDGSATYLGLGFFTKCLCSAVFISERDPVEFITNSDGLMLDKDLASKVQYTIDENEKRVVSILGDSLRRTATYFGDQGCISDAEKGLYFDPTDVRSSLPPSEEMNWPMGDITEVNTNHYPTEVIQQAIQVAFEPKTRTAAFLVVHNEQIIIEEYKEEFSEHTNLEGWSMGKALVAAFIGRLLYQEKLQLDDKAQVAQWQRKGDPRKEITIRNLMQMSSGLRFPTLRSKDGQGIAIPRLTQVYPYTGSTNVFDFAVNRPLESEPGSKGSGLYRNSDPLSLGLIVRNLVEGEGKNYLQWPQDVLFDKIGIRKHILETDRFGNLILTGNNYSTARNWARLGLLFLNDGVWLGERLFPEGFTEFLSTPADSWTEPDYGGLFWINRLELEQFHYSMNGAGVNWVIIIPDFELIVVRLGHTGGRKWVKESLNQSIDYLLQAVVQ